MSEISRRNLLVGVPAAAAGALVAGQASALAPNGADVRRLSGRVLWNRRANGYVVFRPDDTSAPRWRVKLKRPPTEPINDPRFPRLLGRSARLTLVVSRPMEADAFGRWQGHELVCETGEVLPLDPRYVCLKWDDRPRAAIGRDAVAPPTEAEATVQLRALLYVRLGVQSYMDWFQTLEVERLDGETLTVSVPVKFLRTSIMSHYYNELFDCACVAFHHVQKVDIVLRQPGGRPGSDSALSLATSSFTCTSELPC